MGFKKGRERTGDEEQQNGVKILFLYHAGYVFIAI